MKVWGTTDKILRRFILTFMEYTLEFIEPKDLERDLRDKKNPFINGLLNQLEESIGKLDYARYRQIIYRITLYGIWIVFQDPAYTDCGIDMLQGLVLRFKDHPELLIVKDPEEWHINRWWSEQK